MEYHKGIIEELLLQNKFKEAADLTMKIIHDMLGDWNECFNTLDSSDSYDVFYKNDIWIQECMQSYDDIDYAFEDTDPLDSISQKMEKIRFDYKANYKY